MYTALPAAFQHEVRTLAERYGAPIERHAAVCPDTYWASQTNDRDAEVCMVIRRPSGRILTFTKSFYPAGLYRLFTGGVERGESILDALLRETREETGLAVTIRRFLAAVTFSAEDTPPDIASPVRYAAFAFLLDAPDGAPAVSDPDEPIIGYREIAAAGLPVIVHQLESLPDDYSPDLDCSWRDWGRLRAATHRAVAEAL